MPAGEAFTPAQRQEIQRAVADAERASGWVIAVQVGASDADTRGFATALHAQLPDPAGSILVQLDPDRRTLEIVTGEAVRRGVDNRAAGLVAVTMQSAFAGGDLTRGLVSGVRQLAQLGQRPRSLHTDTP
ncbi:MAG: DUF5130 family protein [Nocardioidaceae bacterium]